MYGSGRSSTSKCLSISLCTFVVLAVFFSQAVLVGAMFMPAVLWDPRNPLFNCPSRNTNTILVRMKDYMQFLCPVSNSNLGMQNSLLNYGVLYEIAYFIYPENKQDALTCNATRYSKPFLKCERTQSNWGLTIRIAGASGDPDAPLFHYGKTYYLIGTGNGLRSGLTNKVGGRCSNAEDTPEKKYKMILKIRVCSYEEEFIYKNCTVCKTVGCYNKGCGIYNQWQKWQYFHNISHISNISNVLNENTAAKLVSDLPNRDYSNLTKCFRRRSRSCQNEVTGCDGPSEETEEVPCPKIKVSPSYDNCTEWVDDLTLEPIYAGLVKMRNCTIGNMERMTVTQRKVVKIVKDPSSAQSKDVQTNAVSVSLQVFILSVMGPVVLLAVGFLVGYCYWRTKNRTRRADYIFEKNLRETHCC